MNIDKKRSQILDQYKVVAALAEDFKKLAGDLESYYCETLCDSCDEAYLDILGKKSARWMETLGDMLNNADAATEREWMNRVFRKAHKLFPIEP